MVSLLYCRKHSFIKIQAHKIKHIILTHISFYNKKIFLYSSKLPSNSRQTNYKNVSTPENKTHLKTNLFSCSLNLSMSEYQMFFHQPYFDQQIKLLNAKRFFFHLKHRKSQAGQKARPITSEENRTVQVFFQVKN